ncbi:MAG: cytoplasmic protein [Thermodesulfobacteriota bacterium]
MLPENKGAKAVFKPASAKVIYLKERSFIMLKKDLILRNPLRLLGNERETILSPGGFGAILARAGVGKTSLMVQLALNSLLNSRNVLHISMNDPVKKVSLWYDEVFRHIAEKYQLSQMDQLWEAILPHRFIMTFKVEGFSVPKLEERLTDLTEQSIFFPNMIIIDGLPFSEDARDLLQDLKQLALKHALHVWFSVRTHRHESAESNSDGVPTSFQEVADLFEVLIGLQPEGEEIHVRVLKGGNPDRDHRGLRLDPATMLIMDVADKAAAI